MGFELTTVSNNMPEVRQTHSYILRQANKAMYALAAFKAKISTILSAPTNLKAIDNSMLGVDITPSCIYVCQIDNKGAGSTLTGLASVCMEGKFVSEDIVKDPNLYSESLRKLLAENKIQARKVAVSLPVSSSIVRVATISKMDDIDIRSAIKFGSLWQNIMNRSDSPDNYSIFYQVIRREKDSETMDILVVATKLAEINLYRDIIRNSGLKPVIVDAKTMALHYALKNKASAHTKHATVLIEFGLENNYIMLISDEKPIVLDVVISDAERAAILGENANKNPAMVNGIIYRYKTMLEHMIETYNKNKPEICIENIYVSSALPLIGDFISRLGGMLPNCNINECNVFDNIIIPDNFSISKQNAENNISAWAAAIGMAIMPWKNKREEWIEVRKSPIYGIKYLHHYGKGWKLPDLSIKIGSFDPYEIFHIKKLPTLAGLKLQPNLVAASVALFALLMIGNSYRNLLNDEQYAQESLQDVALNNVVNEYNAKASELASLQNFELQMGALKEQAAEIAQDSNQQYVLSMYSYLNNVLQEGVWLKQLTFTAPNTVEMEGRSMNDDGVKTFLSTLDGSQMFSGMALKHLQSISELDLYAQSSASLKSFVLKGNLSDTLPDEYLNKPSVVAGSGNHGS